MAPASEKELVTISQLAKDNISYSVTLLQLNENRVCTTIFKHSVFTENIVITDLRLILKVNLFP